MRNLMIVSAKAIARALLHAYVKFPRYWRGGGGDARLRSTLPRSTGLKTDLIALARALCAVRSLPSGARVSVHFSVGPPTNQHLHSISLIYFLR